MALIAAHPNAGIILVVTVYSDRYILSLSPHLHTPVPVFSPSLINLMVFVDVKHHVELLTYIIVQELCESPWLSVLTTLLASVDVKQY